MSLLSKTIKNIEPLNKKWMSERESNLNSLLKTPKGLGRLEEFSIQIAGMQNDYSVNKKAVVVMAADNGVEYEGVSASKRVITQYVVEAMLAGEASIASLAKSLKSDLFVTDLGIDSKKIYKGIIDKKIMKKGTKNIRLGRAMTRDQAQDAIEAGIEVIDDLVSKGYNMFALGEMGIGNTTTSSAILRVLTDLPLDDLVGRGSGINDETLYLKKRVIFDAININNPDSEDPIDVISKVGGLDIAAMTGAYLACARHRVPVVIDGLISGVSALLAYRMCPETRDYLIPSHLSEEPGDKWIMKELNLDPTLFMKMKLGEGSGAILMFPMLEAALNITKDVRLYPEV